MTSILHPLRIGKHIARYPIVQGAMAVRVSGAKLAGAVANAGGVGVIASLGLGLHSPAARGDVEHGLIFSGANVRYTD